MDNRDPRIGVTLLIFCVVVGSILLGMAITAVLYALPEPGPNWWWRVLIIVSSSTLVGLFVLMSLIWK